MKPQIITIDGPAGAGKSSLAKEIAKRFGYTHLDSGALYRAIGYGAKERGIDLKNQEEVIKFAKSAKVELKGERVFLNGKDITDKIRTPEGGMLASQVAQYPQVREVVVQILRKIAKGKRVVTDGRDAGSYIFPNAQLKIYLTASPQERAKRRHRELLSKGYRVNFQEILKEVVERDKKDQNRKFAPLRIPKGAVVIDTTGKSLEEVLKEVKKLIDP
ncbi:(d)CMP kinase [Thermovibrio sp.]